MSFALGATVSASAHGVPGEPVARRLAGALAVAFVFGVVVTGAAGLLVGYFRANPIIVSMAALSLSDRRRRARDRRARIYPEGSEADVFKGASAACRSRGAVFLATVLIGQFILSWTRIGREMVHGRQQPARRDRRRHQRRGAPSPSPMCSPALCSAFSAVLLAARYASGDMEHGLGYDYTAISAVLVGGTAIQGGSGSVVRTLVGAIIIAVMEGAAAAARLQHSRCSISSPASSCSASSCCTPSASGDEPMLRWLQAPSVRPFAADGRRSSGARADGPRARLLLQPRAPCSA